MPPDDDDETPEQALSIAINAASGDPDVVIAVDAYVAQMQLLNLAGFLAAQVPN
jgi:hypothetical protein